MLRNRRKTSQRMNMIIITVQAKDSKPIKIRLETTKSYITLTLQICRPESTFKFKIGEHKSILLL